MLRIHRASEFFDRLLGETCCDVLVLTKPYPETPLIKEYTLNLIRVPIIDYP